jgi:hypothetical protein
LPIPTLNPEHMAAETVPVVNDVIKMRRHITKNDAARHKGPIMSSRESSMILLSRTYISDCVVCGFKEKGSGSMKLQYHKADIRYLAQLKDSVSLCVSKE